MHDTYYLLIMVTRAAFLLQVSHTTILGWSRTLKETGMRALLQKQVLVKTLLSAMVEKRPLDCFKESEAIIVVIAGVSVSRQLARVILKTRGYIHTKPVLVHENGYLPPRSQRQHAWDLSIRVKHRHVGLFFSR